MQVFGFSFDKSEKIQKSKGIHNRFLFKSYENHVLINKYSVVKIQFLIDKKQYNFEWD